MALSGTSSVISEKPWWQFGHVWLVIAGPALVVVAGFITLWIAIKNPDPVVSENYYKEGLEINTKLREANKSLAPAVQGRNHAATPAEDLPPPALEKVK